MDTHFITYRPYWDNDDKALWDRYEDFIETIIDNNGRIEGWSARKTFKPGDAAIFYFALPMMKIVAVALVDSDPYVEEVDSLADWSNPVYCDFSPAVILENELAIKEVIKRHPKIAKWWKTKPYQGIRRTDPQVAIKLFHEMGAINSYFQEDVEWLTGQLFINSNSTKPSQIVPVEAPEQAEKPKKKKWTKRDLLRLNWQKFEYLVAELFSYIYEDATVELTAPTVDFGVDVLMTYKKPKQVQIVQCKRYGSDNKVTSVDMQKFAGAMMKFNASKGYFVTSSSFNRFALEFVKGMNDINLIDGQQLIKMINDEDRIPSRAEFQGL